MRAAPDEWRDILPRQPWAWQPGELEAVKLPNPAAGGELVYGPAGGAWERIEFVRARYVASAIAGTRIPLLTVLDGNANELLRLMTSIGPSATQSVVIAWARLAGPNVSITGDSGTAALPTVILRPGWTIATVTAAKDVLDQWSQVAVTVTRYYDADPTLLAAGASHKRRRGRPPA